MATTPDAAVPACLGEPVTVCALDDPDNFCDCYGGDGLQQAVAEAPAGTPELPACIEVHEGTFTPSAAVDYTEEIYSNPPEHLGRALLFVDAKHLRITAIGAATLSPGELRSDGVVATDSATVEIDGLDISGITGDDQCPSNAVERCAWGYVALVGGKLTLSNLATSGTWGPRAYGGSLVLDEVTSANTLFCGRTASIEVLGGAVSEESDIGALDIFGSCQATVEGTAMTGASGAIVYARSNTSLTVRGATIAAAGIGVSIEGNATADLSGLKISGAAQHALRVIDNSNAQVRNSLFLDSAGSAVYVDNTTTLVFDNNTIVGATGMGIQIDQCDTDPIVRVVNNIIVDVAVNGGGNFGFGIASGCGGEGNDTFANNLKFGLARPSEGCADLQICDEPGEVEGDPMFVGSDDYHLQTGSPAINAGYADLSDPDGSDSDIGAYGGPGACVLDAQLGGC